MLARGALLDTAGADDAFLSLFVRFANEGNALQVCDLESARSIAKDSHGISRERYTYRSASAVFPFSRNIA